MSAYRITVGGFALCNAVILGGAVATRDWQLVAITSIATVAFGSLFARGECR